MGVGKGAVGAKKAGSKLGWSTGDNCRWWRHDRICISLQTCNAHKVEIYRGDLRKTCIMWWRKLVGVERMYLWPYID